MFTIYAAEQAREAASKEFWAALHALEAVKLVEFVPYLFESDQPEAELIHAYAVNTGEPWERELSIAAHRAGFNCLSPGQQQWTNEQRRLLVPVPSHIDKLAVIGIARLNADEDDGRVVRQEQGTGRGIPTDLPGNRARCDYSANGNRHLQHKWKIKGR